MTPAQSSWPAQLAGATRALRAQPGCKVVGIVHAETSTGMHQPLEEI